MKQDKTTTAGRKSCASKAIANITSALNAIASLQGSSIRDFSRGMTNRSRRYIQTGRPGGIPDHELVFGCGNAATIIGNEEEIKHQLTLFWNGGKAEKTDEEIVEKYNKSNKPLDADSITTDNPIDEPSVPKKARPDWLSAPVCYVITDTEDKRSLFVPWKRGLDNQEIMTVAFRFNAQTGLVNRGVSICSANDKFDFQKGCMVALKRLFEAERIQEESIKRQSTPHYSKYLPFAKGEKNAKKGFTSENDANGNGSTNPWFNIIPNGFKPFNSPLKNKNLMAASEEGKEDKANKAKNDGKKVNKLVAFIDRATRNLGNPFLRFGITCIFPYKMYHDDKPTQQELEIIKSFQNFPNEKTERTRAFHSASTVED